jgi:AraC-like DNA-binding protein
MVKPGFFTGIEARISGPWVAPFAARAAGSAIMSAMPLSARRPGPPLGLFVEKLWSFQGYLPSHALERILPDGAPELVVNLSEDRSRIYDREDTTRVQSLPGSLVSGPRTRYAVIDTAEQVSTVGVHFRPGGAYPFFGLPASELENRHVALEDLWGGFAREVRERLLAAGTVDARLGVLERALAVRLWRPPEFHPAVAFARGEFRRVPAARTIGDVTRRIALSPRRFIEVFRAQVGVTPKRFCRVKRFQRAVQTIASGRGVEWVQVALDCGYFDQAHFIHDFREFAGLTPAAYAGMRVRHPNHVPM